MHKILWIWEIVIDKTYFINCFPEEWLKYQATDSITWIWWSVPCALKFLYNMWCSVTLIWSVWKDHNSITIEKQLANFWIKTSLIYDKTTKVNTVIVNNKNWERTIIKDKIENSEIENINIDLILEADVIIFDRTEKKAFDFTMKYKREETIIMVDPSTQFDDNIIDFMKKSNIAIFPIETVDKMSKLDNIKHNLDILYNKIWKTIIITDWWNWTYIFDWEKRKIIPALDIVPTDTNWAWDVFRWAYIWWLLKSWDTVKTVIFSNKVAWLQCTQKWNLIAVPEKKDLINLL
jgi:sugar/nucleoside kinase (ribokinase family)